MTRMNYLFSQAEMDAAYDAWGANCGPAALAFGVQKPLDVVRGHLVGFEQKRYTNPTMMRDALASLGQRYEAMHPDTDQMFDQRPALVRVQWTGPWTELGANPKWAYRQTHWICSWVYLGQNLVFDCNAGMQHFGAWQEETVKSILKECVPRNDGGWFPTHVWRLR